MCRFLNLNLNQEVRTAKSFQMLRDVESSCFEKMCFFGEKLYLNEYSLLKKFRCLQLQKKDQSVFSQHFTRIIYDMF